MVDIEKSGGDFARVFGHDASSFGFAPGRVNIIGAHMDYNGGRVISAALPFGTMVCAAFNDARRVRMMSDQQQDMVELPPGELASGQAAAWTRYIAGVLIEIGLDHAGLDIYVASDLLMRKGLASSGALTVATAMAVSQLVEREYSQLELALLCQRVEHKYVNVMCGLLDQYTAIHARASALLLLDCETYTHEVLEFPVGVSSVIVDCGIARQLGGSQYNVRRAECRRLAQMLGRKSLRGLTRNEAQKVATADAVLARRAEHVIGENERVSAFAEALRRGDQDSMKRLMSEAHRSCRDLYECSVPELDFLVECSSSLEGCIGSRLTGAGWGGATVNLVRGEHVDRFCRALSCEYERHTGRVPGICVAEAAGRGAWSRKREMSCG